MTYNISGVDFRKSSFIQETLSTGCFRPQVPLIEKLEKWLSPFDRATRDL